MKSEILIHPEELNKKWIDRLAEQQVTVLGIHPVGGSHANKTLADMLALLETESFRSLIDYAKSKGLEIEYEFHAMGYLLDRELYQSHPEYFRENENGERTSDLNFCVSNGEALRIVAERAVGLTEKLYGSNENYYFWFDDSAEGFCHCKSCRKLSSSDQQLIALNKIASEIRKKRPSAKLAFLAYQDTMKIPEKTEKAEGVFLEYAPIDKGRHNEIYSESAGTEAGMRLPLIEFFGAEDSKVLEYWLDNSLFSGWRKPPKRFTADGKEIERDIDEYVKLGYRNIATFGCYLGSDYEELYGEPDITPFTQAVKKYYLS